MTVVVQKYGGSSLADVDRVKGVAAAIVARHRAGHRVVVVVSAMGKTTDELMARAGGVSRHPPRRELDMLLTAGERISMALMSMAIHELGENAISFTGSQSGIVTESAHQGARIIAVRPERIETALASGQIVIVAGYQGVSLDREVTTLGRGGSDTSAVALAAALGARVCEIYSDVDGVYSADPRVCPQAQLLAELPYEVMQSMAGSGAKVLNADAVEFARRAEIAIEGRKTGDGSSRRTRIGNVPNSAPSTVYAVVGAPAVTRVCHSDSEWRFRQEQIAETGARPMRLLEHGPRCEVWLDRTDVVGRSPEVVEAALPDARLDHGAAVTVLGAAAHRWFERARAALPTAPLASFLGPSDAAFFVAAEELDAAVRALHAALVE
ncbi:MAG: aspartate kinase [Myxococcota bacterium]